MGQEPEPFNDKPTVTLEEARDWLRARVRKGAVCPCCKRFAKVYKRKLNSGMAYVLIRLYRVRGFEPTHINQFIGEQKMTASMVGGVLLHQWGLIEEIPGDDDGPVKYQSGFYRVTELGARFVTDRVRVRKFVHLYDNKLLRVAADDETVSIREALTDKFDYQELMGFEE
jgi:hypothetical protein